MFFKTPQRLFQHSKNTRGAIPIFKTPQRLFQHSKHQRGYSYIQNTTYIIPTLIKQHIYYANIQITRGAISIFKAPQRLFQHSKHQRGYSYINICGGLNVGISPLVF
jgi:hypothetical protein